MKALTGPHIKKLLAQGKLPIDAFFEGQLETVILAAHEAFSKAESYRTDVLALASIHPVAPIVVATIVRDALAMQLTDAAELQRRETLRNWLVYQAQARLNSDTKHKPPASAQGQESPVTNMDKFVTGSYQSYGLPGVIFVDAHLELSQRPAEGAPVYEWKWHAYPLRATCHGLSGAMLAMLGSQRIRDLRLPIVYRVASYSYRSSTREPHVLDRAVTPDQFSLAVDETGGMRLSETKSWHNEQLQAFGGESRLHHHLGANTLIGLRVKADKD